MTLFHVWKLYENSSLVNLSKIYRDKKISFYDSSRPQHASWIVELDLAFLIRKNRFRSLRDFHVQIISSLLVSNEFKIKILTALITHAVSKQQHN